MENLSTALDYELINCILRLDEAEKKSVLQLLQTFVRDRENNFDRISIERYNKEIDEAVARVKAGEYYTQEEVLQMAKDW